VQEERDEDDNFLLAKVVINEHTVILGSIYGPNNSDDRFFVRLNNSLARLGNYPIVLGGDWNTTFCSSPLAANIDVINMQNLPNPANSKSLNKLCRDFKLTDPYRILWPDRIDYTYIPRDVTKLNRSRIDFFVLSKNIVPRIKKCDILPTVQSKLFDHKAICINFNRTKLPVTIPTVSPKICNDPDLPILVEISVLEIYTRYSAIPSAEQRQVSLGILGRCRRLLREAGPDPAFAGGGAQYVNNDIEQRIRNIDQIRFLLNNFNLNLIQNGELLLPDDDFLEILINDLRNDIISYQTNLLNTQKEIRKKLLKRLKVAKEIVDFSVEDIATIENELRSMDENDLNFIVEKNSLFENIHTERITPFFLKVIKGNVSISSQNSIKGVGGAPFLSDNDRKEYIREHFASIYKKNPNEPNDLRGCIENFLGEEILNNPVVTESRLSEEETTTLDAPLSMEELNKAVEGANSSSAPGIDGFNTRFIKKFWHFLALPLHRYATKCFENGRLTRSFKTAVFKLIPKKGDCSDINKWRPISLLSCLYKVISRAINNRLKLVVNRFTTRAQKGFTQHRYIQEVLINVIETINHCKLHGINGAIISIDQSKAFDTISHKYMSEVFRFFGFGPNFINMMETIGTGRTAMILFEDGTYSREIELGRCRPQGDGPSPIQYNMGESILLMKIELDPRIASVFNHLLAPNFNMKFNPPRKLKEIENNYAEHFNKEKYRNTDKANAFADDTTVATIANYESLSTLKNILFDFSVFSGLSCNVEKTTITLVGNIQPVSQEILDLGFKFVEEFTLLGANISNNLSNIDSCFQQTLEKINSIRDFWTRLKLTLPGRIAVSKTFMISLIGYLGCIITPPDDVMRAMQKTIDDFCIGTLKVAKNRKYEPAKLGGLGLINLKDFVTALQCSWIKRLHFHGADTWRFDLLRLCNGNPFLLNTTLVSMREHPIIYNIAKSFEVFSKKYYCTGKNYLRAYILGNPLFVRGRGENGILCKRFFGLNLPNQTLEKIANVKLEDLLMRGGIKSLAQINIDLGIDLTLVTYMRLSAAITYFIEIKQNVPPAIPIGICAFLMSFDKGSRKIRKVLTSQPSNPNIEKLTSVVTFHNITETGNVVIATIKNAMSFWNFSAQKNTIRDFCFKFMNNQLGLNTRVSHFVPNHSRTCTFCVLRNDNNVSDESFLHLFFDCQTTKALHVKLIAKHFSALSNLNDLEKKRFWFLGEIGGKTNLFITTAVFFFNFLLWNMKLKKNVLQFSTLENNWLDLLDKAHKQSQKIRESVLLVNFDICRRWHG